MLSIRINISKLIFFAGFFLCMQNSFSKPLGETFEDILDKLPAKVALSEAKSKVVKDALYQAGTKFANNFTPEVRSLLEKQAEVILESKVEAATRGFGETFKAKSKDIGIGLVIGIVNEMLHAVADSVFEKDGFGDTLAREQMKLWADIGSESLTYAISEKTPLDTAQLVLGFTKASGSRVAESIKTGIAVRDALDTANLKKKEGELWRNVLNAYVLYSQGKSESWRKTAWKEMVLYHLGKYEKWMKKYYADNDNFELLVAFEKKKKWLFGERIAFEEKINDSSKLTSSPYDPLGQGDSRDTQQRNDDLKNDEVASNHNTDGNGENTDGGNGNTEGGGTDTGGTDSGGGEGNTALLRTIIGSSSGVIWDGEVYAPNDTVTIDAPLTAFDQQLYDGITWGEWENGSVTVTRNNGTSMTSNNSLGYWLSGNLSAYSQNSVMPVGEATYNGEIRGFVANPDEREDIYNLAGLFSSTVDFSDSSIITEINNLYADGLGNPTLDSLILSGSITDGLFSIDAYSDFGQYEDIRFIFEGDFYGDNYQSLGGALYVDGDEISGLAAFAGTQQSVVSSPQETLLFHYSGERHLLEAQYTQNGQIGDSYNDRSQESNIFSNSEHLFDRPEDYFSSVNGSIEDPVGSETEHLNWGRWNGTIELGGFTLEANPTRGYWVSGKITPSQNIPNTGSASYSGNLLGIARINNSDFYDLSGQFAMNIDFGSGSVDTTLSRVNYHTGQGLVTIIDANGANVQGALRVTDTENTINVSGSYSSENINHQFNGTQINMRGSLYGDNADAVGGTFRLLNTFPDGTSVLDANGIFYSTSKTSN